MSARALTSEALHELGLEPGELVYGVEHGGARHRAFVLDSLTVAQTLLLEKEGAGIPEGDDDAQVKHRMKALAYRLVRLGEIPGHVITPDWLYVNLKWSDLLQLQEAASRLERRLADFRQSLASGEEGGLGARATAAG